MQHLTRGRKMLEVTFLNASMLTKYELPPHLSVGLAKLDSGIGRIDNGSHRHQVVAGTSPGLLMRDSTWLGSLAAHSSVRTLACRERRRASPLKAGARSESFHLRGPRFVTVNPPAR